MDSADEIYLMEHPDSTEEIPTLDIAAFLRGDAGAREKTAAELLQITRTVGFFYLTGHGIPQDLFDRIFTQSKRFHELPLDVRRQMPKRGPYGVGHRPMEDRVNPAGDRKPNLSSSYGFHRERELGGVPHVPAGQDVNDWPVVDLPGFRETVVEYFGTIEALGKRMLPLWATAFQVPDAYMEDLYKVPRSSMSLICYPPQKEIGKGQFGIAPHTDNGLMTFLAQHDVPGIAIRMPSGHWRVADIRPGALLINTGNAVVRWGNDQLLSTKHRVINTAGKARYSIPFFFSPDETAVIECLPAFCSEDRPARYPPIKAGDLAKWYFGNNGAGIRQKAAGPDVKSDGLWVPVAEKAD